MEGTDRPSLQDFYNGEEECWGIAQNELGM